MNKLFFLILILSIACPVTVLSAVPAVDGASASWQTALEQPSELISVANNVQPLILIEYASTNQRISWELPQDVVDETAKVKPVIMVEYATANLRHELIAPSNGDSSGDINTIDEYVILTNGESVTLSSGVCTCVYGCKGTNNITLKSGALARLVNMPDSNTITIQSNSSSFTVSRSGATVTFEGTDGTTLVLPATTTTQSIVFNDKTLELIVSSGTLMLGDQLVLAQSAGIE